MVEKSLSNQLREKARDLQAAANRLLDAANDLERLLSQDHVTPPDIADGEPGAVVYRRRRGNGPTLKQAVFDVVKPSHGLTRLEIVSALKSKGIEMSKGDVSTNLSRLRREGLVRQMDDGSGKWSAVATNTGN